MKNPILGRSVEYNDNRVSKYTSQKGKCSITKIILTHENLHCHHIIPIKDGGTDRYQNLVIIHKYVHVLVHATSPEVISKYLSLLDLDSKQIKKINDLRLKVKNGVIKV
ncbi:HNH endonuclease [Clostridium beijerinckii]|uniref:HNH endonuclease n=1 Tax=Clostridium beijerinckii TaxID=1520 RepID=UPI0014947D77|nr:HNH endonuclease signature motif containing protein [Clostridium beijerinckii]NOW06677.1 hypothetical protein [Clostridium beijerinckii]NYC00180.1 hypothetical protein [Clostridium beijerinckii]